MKIPPSSKLHSPPKPSLHKPYLLKLSHKNQKNYRQMTSDVHSLNPASRTLRIRSQTSRMLIIHDDPHINYPAAENIGEFTLIST